MEGDLCAQELASDHQGNLHHQLRLFSGPAACDDEVPQENAMAKGWLKIPQKNEFEQNEGGETKGDQHQQPCFEKQTVDLFKIKVASGCEGSKSGSSNSAVLVKRSAKAFISSG